MKRLSLIFLVAGLACYIALCAVDEHYQSRRRDFVSGEFEAIQTLIQERFKLYERNAVTITKLADLYWQQPVVTDRQLAFGLTIVESQPEVLGANVVDPEGLIVQVYPIKDNSPALGKRSQNIQYLKQNDLGEGQIWMSPPFELYQRGIGFAYYLPLITPKKFLGWYGIVISQERFTKLFMPQLRNFHLILQDAETKRNYLETAPFPSVLHEHYVRTTKFSSLGREFVLYTWTKDSLALNSDWPLLIVVSVLVAMLVTLAARFFLLRRQGQRQLAQLNALLHHIIIDTAASMSTIKSHVQIMQDDPRQVPWVRVARHVEFVVELIEQIKLIRDLADTTTSWPAQQHPLLQSVLEVIDLLSDQMNQKQLVMDYNPDELSRHLVTLNQKLFVHTVLNNILATYIRLSPNGSTIRLRAEVSEKLVRLRFTQASVMDKAESSDELALAIAQQVIEMQKGTWLQLPAENTLELGIPT